MAAIDVTRQSFDYVVVGAGPAGQATAAYLAKAGFTVAVFEMRARPTDFQGSFPVVLNNRGMKALEDLDPAVAERAKSMGVDVKELHITPNNRTVAQVPTYGTCIMRDQVQQILLESNETKPEITFFWEHKLAGIDFASHVCTFEAPDSSKIEIETKRLVGADGNYSKVRRFCEAEIPDFNVVADPWGFNIRFMNSQGKPEQTEVDPAVHYVLGDMGYCCQQPDERWSFSLRVMENDPEFLTADEPTDERVRQLREYTEQNGKKFADNLCDDQVYRKFYDCKSYNGVVVKCSSLNPVDWIGLVGDAAHAVMPATGEGINSGLEDASVLGACVRDQPEDPFGALNARHLANAHALYIIASRSRSKVVGMTPRDKVTSVITTIGLGIAKKMRIIKGTCSDFMLGEMARECGSPSYAELVDMEDRQTRFLTPVARGIAKIFRVPKENPPLPQVAASEAQTSESEPHVAPDAGIPAGEAGDCKRIADEAPASVMVCEQAMGA